ncbi:hypothetical protein K1T71_004628 [Dendrolimus kikuchii]|uniref:Uncharacterized protein n=1 Tax=Dendrolimus kikuchii TaxID=765133 RepID=A0ACC1D9E4_9NEOP|nr:hypothetical protein K1T71_004628 [Dendrolimus kikuchii]
MNKLTDYIAFDYKLVGVETVNSKNMVACVSVVNSYGICVYDTFIRPRWEVVDYRTETSGITPIKLERGLDFYEVKQDICSIIRGRVLIGHRIERALKLFGLCHPEWNTRELTDYDLFEKSVPTGLPSIRYLARHFLGINTSIPQPSLEKARLAMQLYTLVSEDWEEMLQNTDSETEDSTSDSDDY